MRRNVPFLNSILIDYLCPMQNHTTDHFEKEKETKFWQLIVVQKEEGDHELDYDTFSKTKMLACATFGMTWATCHFSSRT